MISDPLMIALLLAFTGLLVIAGGCDLAFYRIPNWISLAIALLFPAQALTSGMGGEEAGWHAALGAGFFVVGLALQWFRLFGGGDVKLLAAVALWLGWPKILAFLAATALAGGALAILILTARMFLHRRGVLRTWRILSPKAGVPYGAAMAAAGLWMLFRA